MIEAAKLPPLKKIFGTFFQSGEIAILAGDTGLGKSIFGVEIANANTNNRDLLLDQEIELKLGINESVLLLDFELSQRQFFQRYENYKFPSNFLRAELNPMYTGEDVISFEYLNQIIEQNNAEIIILDNISALSLRSTQEADIALQVMRGLKQLARKGKSVLVLAHIPKIPRNIPLANDHLSGSKHLANFADSIFFLGQSNENQNYRYIKQTKCRNAELMKEVLVVSIERENDFLGFHMIRYDSEINHLSSNMEASDVSLSIQKKQVLDFHQQGKSYREIAALTNIPRTTVGRWIKKDVPKSGTHGTGGTPNGTLLVNDKSNGSEELAVSHKETGHLGTDFGPSEN